MDISVLYGLMVDLKYVSSGFKAFKGLATDQWRSFLHIDHLGGKDAKFTGTVDTDGTSICVHFVREKVTTDEDSSKKFVVRKDDFVISNDPGLHDIATLAIPKKDEDGAKVINQKDMTFMTFSRRQYYHDSGINRARKHSQKWNNDIRSDLDALSTVSTRGSSLVSFRAFMNVYNTHIDALWEEYTKQRWARQRLRLYGGKKRAFAKFFNRLEKKVRQITNKDIVIAYGAGRAVAKKGSIAALSTRASREFSARFTTTPVEEFRTTYTHHEHNCVLKKVAKKRRPRTTMHKICYGDHKGGRRGCREVLYTTVRGLLWCDSTSSKANKHFVDRLCGLRPLVRAAEASAA